MFIYFYWGNVFNGTKFIFLISYCYSVELISMVRVGSYLSWEKNISINVWEVGNFQSYQIELHSFGNFEPKTKRPKYVKNPAIYYI